LSVRRQALKRLAALGSLLALAVGLGSAWSSVGPNVLYLRLVNRPFPASELPDGYTSLKVSGALDPDFGMRGDDHRIGTVRVTLTGPDQRDDVFYDIFSTTKDARRGLSHPNHNLRRVGRIRGYAEPSGLFAVKSVGGYLAVVVRGDVAISGMADSFTAARAKNSALKLLAAGYKHLRIVEVR
jgi:hypothetical protein